jgi:hypothetical protein
MLSGKYINDDNEPHLQLVESHRLAQQTALSASISKETFKASSVTC